MQGTVDVDFYIFGCVKEKIMRIVILCVLFLLLTAESFGQLVRRKDYDAAFALQAGGETGVLIPWSSPGLSVRPTGGLKMTFPFTRKWFLGGEVNYSEFKFSSRYVWDGGEPVDSRFFIRQLQVPVYLKYMLNCNRASVLFGVFGSYFIDKSLDIGMQSGSDGHSADGLDVWNGGLVIGYEYQIVKHFNVMLKICAGAKELLKSTATAEKRLCPVQASLTLSLDVLRIGDCGCD